MGPVLCGPTQQRTFLCSPYELTTSLCSATRYLYALTKALRENEQESYLKGKYDRGHPYLHKTHERTWHLEDTLQFRYEQLLGERLPEVTLHRGGRVQEELREMGAVAAARGTDVYVREEAYNEGTTLTDAILLHELTHVIQRENNTRLTSRDEIADAESTAEYNEKLAEYNDNPCYYAKIGGRLFYLNKDVEKQALAYAIQYLRRKIDEEKTAGNVALLSALTRKLERSV